MGHRHQYDSKTLFASAPCKRICWLVWATVLSNHRFILHHISLLERWPLTPLTRNRGATLSEEDEAAPAIDPWFNFDLGGGADGTTFFDGLGGDGMSDAAAKPVPQMEA